MTESSIWTDIRARAASADVASGGGAVPDAAPVPEPGLEPAVDLPEPEGWSDPMTGTDGPRFWERTIRSEGARRRRYRHTVTIAMLEFDGLPSDGGWLGRDRAMQLFVRVARVLAHEVRTSDYIARIGPTRFGILLIEADEISAINFFDRVRAAIRKTPGTGPDLVVRTGWASPGEDETIDAAVHRAGARLGDPSFQSAR